MDYDLVVFIGRFQIFHTRHLSVILRGLEFSQKIVVLIGSANIARSLRNPFTFEERQAVIKASVADAGYDADRVVCLPLQDAVYDDEKWKADVFTQVAMVDGEIPAKTALIGYEKDHTGYFLKMFPEWGMIPIAGDNVSSSYMRRAYFSNIGHLWANNADGHKLGDGERDKLIPTPTRDFLMEFLDSAAYKELYAEAEWLIRFKRPYNNMEFPPTFNVAEACITHGRHVLLTERIGFPGRRLWGMPGDFVKHDATIRNTLMTKLKQYAFDTDKIAASRVFDNPERDPRGRVISHTFHIKLSGNTKLPTLMGNAKWQHVPDIKHPTVYADHFDIINILMNGGKHAV